MHDCQWAGPRGATKPRVYTPLTTENNTIRVPDMECMTTYPYLHQPPNFSPCAQGFLIDYNEALLDTPLFINVQMLFPPHFSEPTVL